MALIATEGFGFSTAIADYVTYGVLTTSGTIASSSIGTGGPLGDNYLQVAAAGSAGYQRAVSFGSASVFVGTRINNPGAAGWVVVLTDGAGSTQVYVESNSLGGATIYRGSATSIGTVASGTFPTTGWFYFELGAVIASGTGGSVTVRCNGTQVASVTGANTQGASSTTVGGVQSLVTGSTVQYAHQYFCDNTGSSPWNTFLGDVRVQTLLPTSNASVAFTPNGLASNYLNAAKVPPVPATDYNSSSTVSAQDTFNYASMASTLGTVYGVIAKAIVSKSDAGARSVQLLAVSGGTTATGATISPGTSALQSAAVFAVDPNTSAAWTQTAVNAATMGYKVSA
jgi:hypothetical protein